MADETKCDGVYRRQFLRCGLTGTMVALAGLAAKTARAQDFPKADQASAGYHDNATAQTCDACALFQPPDQCKVVQGPISPTGTCIYFSQ
jgi:hypothetical protein